MLLPGRDNPVEFQRELKREQRQQSWQIVAAWISCIYLLAFVAVPLSDLMTRLKSVHFLMILLFLFSVFFFILSLFGKAGIHKTRTFILTLSTISVFALQYFTAPFAAKQFHLIEYSILSYLIYGAVQRDLKGTRVWFLVFMATLLVGLGDEALQRFIPKRFPSLHDVLFDMKGAAFGLMFAAIVEFEKKLVALYGREP